MTHGPGMVQGWGTLMYNDCCGRVSKAEAVANAKGGYMIEVSSALQVERYVFVWNYYKHFL